MGVCQAGTPLHDPTRPSNHVNFDAASHNGWQLDSVLISSHRRVAIVNGEIVAPGDQLAGYTVKQILPDSVLLTGLEGPLKLTLLPALDRNLTLAGRSSKRIVK